MRQVRRFLLGSLLVLGMIPGLAQAEAIRLENYSEVVVENLQIGSTYSMVKLVNLPLKVVNLSEETIVVALETIKPTGERIKPGFAAIPDRTWVALGNSIVAMAPRDVYQGDVTIAIPDKKAYLGKKYQIDIRARILPQAGRFTFSMGVQGKLLFTVAPIKAKYAPEVEPANLAYSMSPERVDLKAVEVGKKVEVLVDGKPVVIRNEGDKAQTFVLSSLGSKTPIIKLENKTEWGPSPDNLTFASDELTVDGGKEKAFSMSLEIPDKPEYRGKKFQYLVAVKAGHASAVARYLRVMVETAK